MVFFSSFQRYVSLVWFFFSLYLAGFLFFIWDLLRGLLFPLCHCRFFFLYLGSFKGIFLFFISTFFYIYLYIYVHLAGFFLAYLVSLE